MTEVRTSSRSERPCAGIEDTPELLACPVFEVFFGGARGGGKTDGMPPAANQKATSVASSIGVTPPTEPTKRQKADSCAQFLQS